MKQGKCPDCGYAGCWESDISEDCIIGEDGTVHDVGGITCLTNQMAVLIQSDAAAFRKGWKAGVAANKLMNDSPLTWVCQDHPNGSVHMNPELPLDSPSEVWRDTKIRYFCGECGRELSNWPNTDSGTKETR